MASFNRVILMGNLTRDPEVRQSQSGTYVVKFGLAVNERVPDGQGGWKQEPSFVDCVVFGKRGEAFSRFMRKGSGTLIEGKLRQQRWQDKETQQTRSKIEVIVDSWEFAGGNAGDGEGGGGAASDFPGREDFGKGGAPTGGAHFPDDVPF